MALKLRDKGIEDLVFYLGQQTENMMMMKVERELRVGLVEGESLVRGGGGSS